MTLLLGLFFGAIGTAYFIYGRQQHDALALGIGVALAVYPYFFSNVFLVLLIGAALAMIPIARSKGWF
jgi:hypothetical protein